MHSTLSSVVAPGLGFVPGELCLSCLLGRCEVHLLLFRCLVLHLELGNEGGTEVGLVALSVDLTADEFNPVRVRVPAVRLDADECEPLPEPALSFVERVENGSQFFLVTAARVEDNFSSSALMATER